MAAATRVPGPTAFPLDINQDNQLSATIVVENDATGVQRTLQVSTHQYPTDAIFTIQKRLKPLFSPIVTGLQPGWTLVSIVSEVNE